MEEYKTTGCLRGCSAKGCGRHERQLNVYDYLSDIPHAEAEDNLVEVQFKNTRKEFFINSNRLNLQKGDIVAVEAAPGHDLGIVTLTGALVDLQRKRTRSRHDADFRRVYRKARPIDIEMWKKAQGREHATMIRARQIAAQLGLKMKIGDVEYQGDGARAIFYYIADGRVDFRQLIKDFAQEFRIKIEMKQIGARQEAGRIGGIGPCGRELCCATWNKSFVSVSTAAVRFQDLSPNPLKLAGQCAKLRCCLNYEIDAYVEASSNLPPREVALETQDASYYVFKIDKMAGLVTYSTDKHFAVNTVVMPIQRALEILHSNRNGKKPLSLSEENVSKENVKTSSDVLIDNSLTRFDKQQSNSRKGGRPHKDDRRKDRAPRGNRSCRNTHNDGQAKE